MRQGMRRLFCIALKYPAQNLQHIRTLHNAHKTLITNPKTAQLSSTVTVTLSVSLSTLNFPHFFPEKPTHGEAVGAVGEVRAVGAVASYPPTRRNGDRHKLPAAHFYTNGTLAHLKKYIYLYALQSAAFSLLKYSSVFWGAVVYIFPKIHF